MIPAWVASYIDIPWREKGRDRAGVDCWGLLRLVLLERFQVELPSYADDYVSTADRHDIAALLNHEIPALGWHPVVTPAEGDGVLFRILGEPWHVGLVVDVDPQAPTCCGMFLHVPDGGASCVERLESPRWARRIRGFYRLAGLEARA